MVPQRTEGRIGLRQHTKVEYRNIKIKELPPEEPQQVDLLKLIDPKRDSVHGTWKFEGAKLVTPEGRLIIPYVPPAEYEIEMEVERKTIQRYGLNLGFVIGGRQSMVVVDGFHDVVPISGLETLDGKSGAENETTFKGRLLELDRLAKVRLRVEPNKVTFAVDGKTIIQWQGDPKRLDLHKIWSVPNKDTLFLGAIAVLHIHKMTLTPLRKKLVEPEDPVQAEPKATWEGHGDESYWITMLAGGKTPVPTGYDGTRHHLGSLAPFRCAPIWEEN